MATDDDADWPGLIAIPGDRATPTVTVRPDVPTVTVRPDAPRRRPPPAAAPADDWPGMVPVPTADAGGTSLLDNLGQGTAAAVHGLAAVPGMIYDAAAVPQNLLASMTNAEWLRAQPARDAVAGALDAVGLPGEPDPTLSNRVIEGVAATLPTLGYGSLAAGAKGVPGMIGRALGHAPIAQIVGGAGSGVGQQVAEGATDNPIVRTAGPLIGALTGAGLVEGSTAAARWLTSPSASPQQIALKALMSRTTDPAGAVRKLLAYQPDAEGASLLDPSLPAPDPTGRLRNLRSTAEVVDDPGAFGVEQVLRNLDNSEGGSFAQRTAQRQEARSHILDGLAPPGGANAGTVTDALAANAGRAELADTMANQGAAAGLADSRAALGTEAVPEQTGPVLQAQFDAERLASSANVGELLGDVDPDNTTAIRTKPIKDQVNEAATREYGVDPADWPGDVRQILRRLAMKNTTFAELQNIRSSNLRAMQGDAWRRDPNLAAVRSAAVDAIHDHVAATAEAGGDGFTPAHFDRWNRFRAAAREHGARFGEDVGSRLAQKNYGRPETGGATVPGRFFRPGAEGADTMAEFNRIFFNNPTANAAMRQHIAGEVGRLFDPQTGAVPPATLARWLSNHHPALRQIPDLARQIGNVGSAARLVAHTAQETAGLAADRAKSVASAWLKRDVDRAMDGVLGAGNRVRAMGQLRAELRNAPQAIDGLRRAFLDVWARAGKTNRPGGAGDAPGIAQAGAEKWWNTNKDAARVIFSRPEMRRLQAVRDDLWSAAKPASGLPAGSPTAMYQSNAQLLRQTIMGHALPGPLHNVVGQAIARQPYVGAFVKALGQMTTDRAMSQLYHLALDPEMTAALLRRATPDSLAQLSGMVAKRDPIGAVTGRLDVPAYAASRAPGALAIESGRRRDQ